MEKRNLLALVLLIYSGFSLSAINQYCEGLDNYGDNVQLRLIIEKKLDYQKSLATIEIKVLDQTNRFFGTITPIRDLSGARLFTDFRNKITFRIDGLWIDPSEVPNSFKFQCSPFRI